MARVFYLTAGRWKTTSGPYRASLTGSSLPNARFCSRASSATSRKKSRFVNPRNIHFLVEVRSLGETDGALFLKVSRKVLLLSLNPWHDGTWQVAQLAGYVSEHSAYHHGEASLNGTIIAMAQNYTGSNNLNLLIPGGQFGTRLLGGKVRTGSPPPPLQELKQFQFYQHIFVLFTR